MSQILTINQQNQHNPPTVRTVHIDRIHVAGPLDHKPIGELFYKDFDADTVIPVGASAFKPNTRRNPEDICIRSKEVQHNGRAYMLEFDCCPPQILQGHNFFGHGNVLDYTYAMFDRQTRKFGLPVDPSQRQGWRTGQVGMTCIHLCANFWCPPETQLLVVDAIDSNNRKGKHRDEDTCITLGFTPKRRSMHHCATTYAKAVLLRGDWLRPGPLQTRIVGAAERSLRVEIKVYPNWLTENDMKYVSRWQNVDVNAIFFKLLAHHKIANAIQPLMTDDERSLLTNAELRAYMLWLQGADLSKLFSRTAVWKYNSQILKKTGVDMRGHRRPEKAPVLDLREILVPENIVPIPQWAYENPRRYWAPGTAFLDGGGELDALAY